VKLGARPSRFLLLAWFSACFVFSALTDPVWLAALLAAMALVFWKQAAASARRTALSAVPLTLFLILASWAWVRFVTCQPPDLRAYAALALRATLIAFTSFAVLARVDLLAALAPWPTLTRLLVIVLGQVHALRLLVTESLLGLRSRLPRKPGVLDAVRSAGGVTATLLTLATKNARDISDAMRSRGF
jgi:cobalt/nickel transport system permease protein